MGYLVNNGIKPAIQREYKWECNGYVKGIQAGIYSG